MNTPMNKPNNPKKKMSIKSHKPSDSSLLASASSVSTSDRNTASRVIYIPQDKGIKLTTHHSHYRPSKPQHIIQPIPQPVLDSHSTGNETDGDKHALLIGINYLKNKNYGLDGCINDVQNVKKMLVDCFHYRPENIVVMTDNLKGSLEPTKKNMIQQIMNVVGKIKPGDTMYMHYSGHGVQIRSKDGDEAHNIDTPNMDDCLCPCDFYKFAGDNRFISDDFLKQILVNKVPIGAKLRAVFDCCHSGSALDLRYMWSKGDKFLNSNSPQLKSNDIILISGCRDHQTSADTWDGERREAGGALTLMLTKVLKNSLSVKTSWKDILVVVRHYLTDAHYKQIPMLSVGEKSCAKLSIDI